MKTKQEEMYLKDTDQTKRMKELALNFAYSNNGEMFRLLSTQVGHDLAKKIKKGVIKLSSTLKYGKDEITTEEKFLENLDNYISYVKNHYFINNIEQFLLLELSLENKYSTILYSDVDFYNCDNYSIYHNEYRRLFLYNFYKNILFFSKLEPSNENFYTIKKDLKNLDFDDSVDILKIENILKSIIINRNNNLFNSFVDNKKITKREYQFYSSQVEWVVADYYEKISLSNFALKESDNYIEVSNDSIILLNISEISENNKFYQFEFGIKNSNFCAKSNFAFAKKDLKRIIERLKIIRENEYYDEVMDFIAADIKLTFWSDRGTEQFLNIEYQYGRDIDYYFLSIGQEDINKFLELIEKQI